MHAHLHTMLLCEGQKEIPWADQLSHTHWVCMCAHPTVNVLQKKTAKNNMGPTGHAALHLFLAWKPVIRNSLPVHRCVCVRVYSEPRLITPPPNRTFIWDTFMFFAVHWFAPTISCLWKSAEPVASLTALRRDVWSEPVPVTAWVSYYVRLTQRYWHMLLVLWLQIFLQGGVFFLSFFLSSFVLFFDQSCGINGKFRIKDWIVVDFRNLPGQLQLVCLLLWFHFIYFFNDSLVSDCCWTA